MPRPHAPPVDLLDRIEPALAARARRAAEWVHERKASGAPVLVVHHIDADGVTAGAIALTCLERAGVRAEALAVKSLDDVHLEKIREAGRAGALWFCDLGSTAYMHFPDAPRLVCDHHELVRDGHEEDFAHLNPLLDGIAGDTVSGAGCAFLAAYAHDAANLDLLPLALVGATADLQDRDGGLHGANRVLLDTAVAEGHVQARTDLGWFGPATRPLVKFLSFAREHGVPSATGDRRTAEAFLASLEVPLRDGDTERCWLDLDEHERRRVRSALVERTLDAGLGAAHAHGLFREVVTLRGEPRGPTQELQEYATLLNSTARYDRADIGLAVARGDRDEAYTEALDLRDGHRKHLVGALDAFRQCGVTQGEGIQWVHLEDRVRDTVVGIVCGMALGTLRQDRPLVGLAHTPDGRTKASSRAPAALRGRVDLATAMRDGAAAVGGQGGGHTGAAGATFPRDQETAFLQEVDRIVAGQLGLGPSRHARAATA